MCYQMLLNYRETCLPLLVKGSCFTRGTTDIPHKTLKNGIISLKLEELDEVNENIKINSFDAI